MFSRLRDRIRALIQLPSQLSIVRMLVEHSIAHSQETNSLLRELLARQSGNPSATPPTPALDLSTLPENVPLPPAPPTLPSPRRRTDADVMVVDRQALLDVQHDQRLRAAQASREGQRIL